MTAKDRPAPGARRRQGRRWLWIWAATVAVMLAFGGIWLVFQYKIAAIAETRIRALAQRRGLNIIRLAVRQITPWQADLHGLRVGDPATDGQLGLDSLVLDYSPAGLKAHVIDRVQLSGLDLRLENRPSGWIVAGVPPGLTDPAKPSPKTPPAQQALTDWRINHLTIHNSRLTIHHANHQMAIPFELRLHSVDQEGQRLRGEFTGQPWNQSVAVNFEVNWPQQKLIVDRLSASMDVAHLRYALTAETALPLSGRLTATGRARLKLAPLAIEGAEIQIRLPDAIVSGQRLALGVLNPDRPAAEVRLGPDRTWTLQSPGFRLTTQPNLQITDLNGRIRTVEDGRRLDGSFNLDAPPPADDDTAMALALPQNGLPVTYRGQWRADGLWSFALTGQSTDWELAWQQHQGPSAEAVTLNFNPRINLRGNGRQDYVRFEADARLAQFRGRFDQMTVRIPDFTLHAAGEGPWPQLQGSCKATADNLRLNTAQLDGRLPRLAVESDFATANGLRISGRARLARGAVQLPERQIQLSGLRLNVPFTWPHEPSTASGRWHLAAATWKDLALGEAHGRIQQQADGAAFRLTHQSPLLPGGRLQIDGRLTRANAIAPPLLDVAYRFERLASADDIDLGRLKKDLAGIHFNGHIAAEGRGTYQGGQMQAGLNITLSDGRLVQRQQKRGLMGLSGGIAFPNLPTMRSAPKQQIVFERAYIGDIAATQGRFDFQIEPGGIFFLEQSRFKWCEGTVYLPATRILPQRRDYDVTLWCDRLKLAPLLEQLGAARAEGGGTVSGSIPVRMRQGQLIIDNGFLYSSPGEGGTIRLHGTEMLTAGIPPGTPQFNQLELARRALEEYDYDWVKLGLATAPQEDLLRLKLQLKGRPSKPLAFIYDSRSGGFVPAGPDSPGSRFEEIKLDVNFSLPLNRLLEYKDLLKLFSAKNGDLYVEKMGPINSCPAGRPECRLHATPG